ncbi:MAG: hypothetical protein AAGD23_09540 [Pseudomonadota bacterium]
MRTGPGQELKSGAVFAARWRDMRMVSIGLGVTVLTAVLSAGTTTWAQDQINENLLQEMPAPPIRQIAPAESSATTVPSDSIPNAQAPGTVPPAIDSGGATSAAGIPIIPGTLQGRAMATLTEVSGPLNANVHWRIYRATPGPDGTNETVVTSDDAQPILVLEPGEYIAVAVYGHAVASTPMKVAVSGYVAQVNLDAGAVRILPQRPGGNPLDDKDVKISIFEARQDDFGERRLIIDDAPSASLVALNAGDYHVVSQFGDANSTIRGDIEVEAGKLNEVDITHSASSVTLKLVNTPGGEALANTAWSILSPGGDIVKESFGAFPTHVLASGTYSVIARHDGQIFNREFSIEGGQAYEVEVVAQ